MTKRLRLNDVLASSLPAPPTGRGATSTAIMVALRTAGRPLSPLEILAATGLDYVALRRQLSRLARRGEIERVAQGLYIAATCKV